MSASREPVTSGAREKLLARVRSLGWKRYMRPEFNDADSMAVFIGEKGLGDEYLVWALERQAEIDKLLGRTGARV